MGLAAALSIFLSAFLLFLVQPMLGKMILPWFGGTPAVWTTCLLFFQVLLLGGYAYAAALARWLSPKRQAWLHLGLLIVALCLLPVTPSGMWKPMDGERPVERILLMLLVCVGMPYFLLSANSPLVQGWFAHTYPGRSPYRLYALSNIGSLGALLAYPFLVEPTLRTSHQGWIWSGAFAVYVIVSGVFAWRLKGGAEASDSHASLKSESDSLTSTSTSTSQVSWLDWLIWLGLPALSSMMLLAVTNHLCQDVAVVPFLWIVPLSIYLITLIICFDRDQWYRPLWFALGAIMASLAATDLAYVYYLSTKSDEPLSRWMFLLRYDIRILVSVYLSLFFFACMLCHGEVVRRRPHASRLTQYYLTISAGGALGGLIVAIVCPAVFTTFLEIRIGLVLCFCLALGVAWRELAKYRFGTHPLAEPTSSGKQTKKNASRKTSPPQERQRRISPWLLGLTSCVMVVIVILVQWLAMEITPYAQHYRNFYGALTVRVWYPEDNPLRGRAMYHGAILHGYQFLTPGKEQTPTTYYTQDSGVGKALLAKRESGPLKVGVVGLGIGTLASYAQKGDTYRMYEINPLVIRLAQSDFTFLKDCQGTVEIVSGDARLSLEREVDQQFDLLVLDAFSGDSIPVHLLTREAMQVYLRHLKPDGLLVVHVSNRYVELLPVVACLGEEFHMDAAHISQNNTEGLHISSSEWMLLTLSPTLLDHKDLVDYRFEPHARRFFETWTDDFNNLFEVMRAP